MMNLPWNSLAAEADLLGESPFWHTEEQSLYWVDVPGRQLRRARGGMGPDERWAMPSEPGCIAPARSGGLVIALRDGIYRAREWGGRLERIVAALHDTATTRFNDGKADPAGRFWAGTIFEPRTAPRAALYSLDCRAGHVPRLEKKAGDVLNANGLAFSPDARTLYWADTARHAVHAWDWDRDSNVMRGHRVLHRFPGKPRGWRPGQPGYGGRPDGAAVDVEGNYWCAMFEGQRLARLSPTGELLEEIALPVRCPTMPCFGGADRRTLFVTTARHARPGDELRQMPLSGRVLWTRVEVPGLPVNFFMD